MMITNKFNLPIPIYNAVNREYQPKENRFSVTDLIGPPLIRRLKLEHWKELTEDASERLWMLLGSAVDYIISKHAEGAIVQMKFEKAFDGAIIVGKPDIYWPQENRIEDWKVTSVWSFLLGDKKDWERQLNCYAWGLWMSKALSTDKLVINAILRDWQKSKMLQDKDYPRIPFVSKEIPLWSFEQQEQYIKDQLEYHRMSEPAECTPEDKWEKPTTYAVMKKGKKRALRVLDSQEKAKEWCRQNNLIEHEVDCATNAATVADEFAAMGCTCKSALNKSITIVERPGECVRCENYCPVRFVCPYRKANNEKENA